MGHIGERRDLLKRRLMERKKSMRARKHMGQGRRTSKRSSMKKTIAKFSKKQKAMRTISMKRRDFEEEAYEEEEGYEDEEAYAEEEEYDQVEEYEDNVLEKMGAYGEKVNEEDEFNEGEAYYKDGYKDEEEHEAEKTYKQEEQHEKDDGKFVEEAEAYK